MNIRQPPRWFLWALILPLFVLNGWVALLLFEYFKSFFTIALAATLIAFILGYPVGWLQCHRLSRPGALAVVVLVFIALLSLIGFVLLPPLSQQISELASQLPDLISAGGDRLQGLESWAKQRQMPFDVGTAITQAESKLSTQVQALSTGIIGAIPAVIANLLDIFLTIVLSIYLVLDGEKVWQGLLRWLPIKTARRLNLAISRSFHNYFVSQAAVAATLGVSMTIAYLILRVPYGLLFGLMVGVCGMVPYGAALAIVAASAISAFANPWLGLWVLIVSAVIDQVIENAIAPKLIGGFIGLNPVWILVSLLIGVKIGGFLGLVIAVPVASSIKTLLISSPAKEKAPSAELGADQNAEVSPVLSEQLKP